jgi:hypothetical protein
MRSSIGAAFRGIRLVARPLIFVQFLLLLAAISYYLNPSVRFGAETVAGWKSQSGFFGAAVSNVFAGFAIAQLARLATRQPVAPRGEAFFQIGFFAVLGVMIDLLYIGLDLMIGRDGNVLTVIKKVLIDMFATTPFVTMPFSLIAFAWFNSGYDVGQVIQKARRGELTKSFGDLLVTCWIYWIPAVSAIYAMPTPPLQFVLYLFAEAGWGLIVVQMTTRPNDSPCEIEPSTATNSAGL